MITIQPTASRFVEIHHRGWDLRWAIQFPEGITSRAGTSMTWPEIQPEWRQQSENSWSYEWRTTAAYIEEQQQSGRHRDADGNPIKRKFALGLALRAEIAAGESEVALTLALTNEAADAFEDVGSEGGCFQARSEAFRDGDEVARSRILQRGKVVSMAELHRTKPIRCRYLMQPAGPDKPGSKQYEWFWGRSHDAIDSPAILGAVSRDGTKAVALGYQHSQGALQNADGHHCLHSQPSFGTIPAGGTVTRQGYILFGEEFPLLAAELRQKLQD